MDKKSAPAYTMRGKSKGNLFLMVEINGSVSPGYRFFDIGPAKYDKNYISSKGPSYKYEIIN